ncbi:MAG: hypothetical protein ACLTDR_07410 [Adlercreutzia equolifaciens]
MWGLKGARGHPGAPWWRATAYKVILGGAAHAGDFICRRAGRRGLGLRGRLAAVEEPARRQGRSPHALRAGGLHAPRPHHAHQPARGLTDFFRACHADAAA